MENIFFTDATFQEQNMNERHWLWQHSHPGAQPGGAFGAICPPRNFQNIAQQFWNLQKLSKNKDEILYSNHF